MLATHGQPLTTADDGASTMAIWHYALAACALAAIFITPPAHSAPKTCVIVVAADRPSSSEIYRHELAHCWGWEHPDQNHKGKPVKGYQSPNPPARFVKPYPNLVDHWVSTKEALRICGGTYGCQWIQ